MSFGAQVAVALYLIVSGAAGYERYQLQGKVGQALFHEGDASDGGTLMFVDEVERNSKGEQQAEDVAIGLVAGAIIGCGAIWIHSRRYNKRPKIEIDRKEKRP